jgi:ATP-binding cassette subfamily F protein uup
MQTVLKFVQEAVEKSGAGKGEGPGKANTAMTVSVAEETGRRKRLAGKEGGVSVEVGEVQDKTLAVSEREAMTLLNRFQFPKQRLYDRVSQLSGGERRRLQLLQVLARNPNVLILDEPSNDLDLQTLTVLEEYLTEVFEGCLIVVSHDNFFVNRVAEHLFVFQGDGVVRDFQGSYTEYLEYRNDVQLEAKASQAALRKESSASVNTKEVKSAEEEKKPATKVAVATKAMSKADMKELSRLERDIARLGEQLAAVDARLADGEGGYSVLAELTSQAEELRGQLAEKEERWLQLIEE